MSVKTVNITPKYVYISGLNCRQLRDGGCVKLWDQEMKRCRAYQLDTGADTDVVKAVSRCKVSD